MLDERITEAITAVSGCRQELTAVALARRQAERALPPLAVAEEEAELEVLQTDLAAFEETQRLPRAVASKLDAWARPPSCSP
jgi:hypothetical protein